MEITFKWEYFKTERSRNIIITRYRRREREREREKGCRSVYDKEREKYVSIVKGRELEKGWSIHSHLSTHLSLSPVSYLIQEVNNKLVQYNPINYRHSTSVLTAPAPLSGLVRYAPHKLPPRLHQITLICGGGRLDLRLIELLVIQHRPQEWLATWWQFTNEFHRSDLHWIPTTHNGEVSQVAQLWG